MAFLAFLDLRPPSPIMRWFPAFRPRFSSAVVRLLANRAGLYARALWQRPSRQMVRDLGDRLRRLATLTSSADPLQGARGEIFQEIVKSANLTSMMRYVPRRYPGTLVLVMAAERKYARGKDTRLAWRELAEGGIDICVVPGGDSGLTLVEPNVRTLAEEFRRRLSRVHAGALLPLVPVTMDWLSAVLGNVLGA